jgi:hypothetical protein
VKTAVWPTVLPRRGVVARRQCVSIAELSRNGCRLDANEPFTIGQIGMLTVDVLGARRVEMFRIARVRSVVHQSHLFEAGVEFLPLPADRASLQDVVVQFEADSRTF